MRITTLGTSHGNATYCRYNSATLYETAGFCYLVDTGEPVVATMIRRSKNLDALKAAFMTHMHNDHISGLPALLKMLMKYPAEGKHIDVFLPEDCSDVLGAWLRVQHLVWPSPMITTHLTRPGPVYDDGHLCVTAEATGHLPSAADPNVPGSFAYILEAEGRRVVHTGDLRGDFSDFPRAALDEPCDLCVCEIAHFPPETALPVLLQAPIGRLVITHLPDRWHDEGEERLKLILADLPYPVDIAHDNSAFVV